MKPPRRDFLKMAAAGAMGLPALRAAVAEPASAKPSSWDSKLMAEAKFIDVNGIRTRYFDGGKGEAMLLVHGGQDAGSRSKIPRAERQMDCGESREDEGKPHVGKQYGIRGLVDDRLQA